MAYRKHGAGGYQVRTHARINVPDKGAAIRASRILASKIAEARRLVREGTAPCCSIGDKMDEFLSDAAAGLGRRRRGYETLKRHRRRLDMFNKAFQRKPIDAIERKQVERWIKRRLATGVTADTVKIDLASLYAFARWARKKQYAPARLPLLDVEKLHTEEKMPGTNQKRPKVLETGELKRVIKKIEEVRPDMALFLKGMVFWGRRPAAVASPRREDATLPFAKDRGRIRFPPLKGGSEEIFSIFPGTKHEEWTRECLAFGQEYGCGDPRSPLVPCIGSRSRKCPGGWTTQSFDMALSRLLKKLRIDITAYVVRHSCMTFLSRQEGVTPASIQKFASHRRSGTKDNYIHLTNADAEIAFQRIGEEFADL